MRSGWGRLALLCLVALGAIAVLVPGGSAGNRTADASFAALPGFEVSAGQGIAYRATFTNTGKSTFTHVIFRMRVPFVPASGSQPYAEAQLVQSSCPTTPVVVTTANGPEWTCDFGKLRPGPQLVITTVWSPPTPASGACDGCLQTTGRWTVNEGVNDTTDVNDAFPAGGVSLAATILAAGSTTGAAGYATNAVQCSDALGQGSLTTNQAVDEGNVTSTTICLPSQLPIDTFDLGLSTTIDEKANAGGPGHSQFDTSVVCIAALGQACEDGYTPADFSPNVVTIVLRGDADVLPKHTQITAVYHDGVQLPWCPASGPIPASGCVVSITLVHESSWQTASLLGEGWGHPHHGGGVWVAVVKSSTNGFYNW
jgi:hypothetical protein